MPRRSARNFSLRTAIARLTPCASSTRKPLPCAPLSLGSRRALRLHANAIVFLVINRISEPAQGHLAPTASASLASENAVSILKNTMHLLRILWNNSECLPHKADAHVGDVTR